MLPLLLLAALSAPAAAAGPGRPAVRHAAVPFVEDDWNLALAAAKERNVPLFVEAWAPW